MEPVDLIARATELRRKADAMQAAHRDATAEERRRVAPKIRGIHSQADELERQAQAESRQRSSDLFRERHAEGLDRPLHDPGRRAGLDSDRAQQYEDYQRRRAEQRAQELDR